METDPPRHTLDKGDGRFFSNVKIQDAGYLAKYSHEGGGDETRYAWTSLLSPVQVPD